ncbi:hypothetical protein LTR84_003271 [Exophiala bonariae]|uniref:NTF2-like domain-containing protein n=1 Tax=Exophiala bonariae TaxID=1690606 RepID=A0AAV9NC23_9EURO|nr:hypothetical protein LTR84_003271 [Exophiala bonariae]
MQVFSVALPLAALVSGIYAAPGWESAPAGDACLAAVTGTAALGDAGLRAFHCKSYLATTVTPAPVVETVTITADGAGKDGWKRGTVIVCPNEVPNYASACDDAHYTSACSKFGFTNIITTTVAAPTTTKTVWVKPTGGVVVSGTTCPAAGTVTKTVSGSAWGGKETVTVSVPLSGSATVITKTVTVSGAYGSHTVPTVTVSGTCTAPSHYTTTTVTTTTTSAVPSKCVVTDALASDLVDGFITLLEFTDYKQPPNSTFPPPGRGYKIDVSNKILNDKFQDISDSINFMAGIPLGSITFPSKGAFDAGQGSQPEVTVKTLNLWHDCTTITWRWVITSTTFPVVGINRFTVGDDGKFIRNYAEFDSGAWLQSFRQVCAINGPPTPLPIDSFATK